jgi:hypothetical protein
MRLRAARQVAAVLGISSDRRISPVPRSAK